VNTLHARTRRGPALVLAGLAIAAVTAWCVEHVTRIAAGHSGRFGLVFTIACFSMLAQTILYSVERPKRTSDHADRQLAALRVVVPVPAFNEDPDLLRGCLSSMLTQQRKPQVVHVVDDGSSVDYTAVRAWFLAAATDAGIEGCWTRTANGGKRAAQCVVFRAHVTADIYLTVDSDAILQPDAIAEVLKPFADQRVQSVAGVVLAANNSGQYRRERAERARAAAETTRRRSRPRVRTQAAVWFTSRLGPAAHEAIARGSDFWFVAGQLTDRSAASTMGAVLVNSGPLAAYRAAVVQDHLASYSQENFRGRRIEFSDDSLLTLYALQRGRAVQQPSAFAFTAMPETAGFHLRQYLRWMRGAFIRSFWRFKYLPLNGYAYWAHAMGWLQMTVATGLFVDFFVWQPATSGTFSPWLLAVPVLVGYGQGLRYLTVARSDQSLQSQLLTYALSPLAVLWAFTVLRVVRWYAMATCLRGGWGTRQNGVEVTLAVALDG
jgi:hyaluronan synthase